MGCEVRKVDDRKRKKRYPKYHRDIARDFYFQRFLARALALHSHMTEWDSKTLLANAYYLYDKVLANQFGKNHFRHFAKHIASFLSENEALLDRDFIRWIESPEGQYHIDQIRKLQSVNERLSAASSLILLYLRLKTNGNGYRAVKEYKPIFVERIAFRVWSKPWFWLLANIFVFDVMYPTATWGAEYRNYYISPDPSLAYYQAVRVNPQRWYEVSRPSYERILWDALYEVGFTILGELISATISSKLLLMTSSAFMRLGGYLYHFAKSGRFRDTFLSLSKASQWIGSMLEKSFIPFLGMNIYVEWPTDGLVQWTLDKIVRYFADPDLKDLSVPMPALGPKEMQRALELIRASMYRELKPGERQLLDFLKEHSSEAQKMFLHITEERARVYKTIENFREFLRFEFEELPIKRYERLREEREVITGDRGRFLEYYVEKREAQKCPYGVYGVLETHHSIACPWHPDRQLYHPTYFIKAHYRFDNQAIPFELSKVSEGVAYINKLKSLYFLTLRIARKCSSIRYQMVADRIKRLLEGGKGYFAYNKEFFSLKYEFFHEYYFSRDTEPKIFTERAFLKLWLLALWDRKVIEIDPNWITIESFRVQVDAYDIRKRAMTWPSGTQGYFECPTGERIEVSVPNFGNYEQEGKIDTALNIYQFKGAYHFLVPYVHSHEFRLQKWGNEDVFSLYLYSNGSYNRFTLPVSVFRKRLVMPVSLFRKPRRKRGKVICKFLL